MPINANAVGIRPVAPERPLRESEGIQRRDEGVVSGFRPQTNVALRTAISDLAGTLERIATSEKAGINKMPSEVGQIIRNILEQSLSLQETLGKGIGSTIESQRFSMEQLSTFGRMLFQLGSLSDRGFSMKISPETQSLLSQFKNLIVSQEGGNALEPVLLSKSAFELLDSKIPEQLPQAMYEILSQLSQPLANINWNQPSDESDIMSFLNKLVKFFMPRPASDNRPATPQQQPQPQPQQNFQQPFNQNQPQNNFQQPLNQGQPQQNFQQPMNQNQPQNNFQQPMNQGQPQQNFQQPFNQNQPQNNFQQPM
ncbi:MAG: hypothetical protein IJS29_09540, partial [Selenomonadaceae bacterium]|nr:hypothetical protein [Selenomonadaceae bacterium]